MLYGWKKAKRYAENDYKFDLMRQIDELHLQHPSWGSRRNSAIVGTFFHAFEWFFFRLAPVALMGAIAGIVVTRHRN